jgi:hypothetical protein
VDFDVLDTTLGAEAEGPAMRTNASGMAEQAGGRPQRLSSTRAASPARSRTLLAFGQNVSTVWASKTSG